MLVSLRDPQRDVASYVSQLAEQGLAEWWESLRGVFSLRDRRLLKVSELERARVLADQAHARLADFLPVREARGAELQWLVRRAFCRGLCEPHVDALHEPRALAFERNGEAVLAPLEADVMRWADSSVDDRGRFLRVDSESGTSWQAQLVLGALPERSQFPGARAELMFAPAESLPFPIDISLNARYLPNDLALRIARRRIQDADQIVRAESDGEQGVTDLGYARTQEARDLLAYLQASSRPPLLRATVAVAVAAAGREQLEERVEMCRRAYGEIRLHRPLGDQLQLFLQHLPGQRTRVGGYDDTLTTEQVAAMMPTATHAAGSAGGYYLGWTLTGSRRPVRFNLREGSDSDRNTTILSVGALGSGKTTLDQKLKYEGFLLGARVIDCDPKGDHRFHLLDDVAPHTECVTLRPDPALRGVLDPLQGRSGAPATGRRRVVSARPAAGQSRACLGDGRRRGRRSGSHALASADVPGDRRCAARGGCDRTAGRQDARGLRTLRSDAARLRRPAGAPSGCGSPAGHIPADPRSAWPGAGMPRCRVLAVRAHRRADRSPDRDVRNASDGRPSASV